MGERRPSEQSLRSGSPSGGTAVNSFTRSSSVDELSGDADLLEIFISSDDEKEEEERMTESSDPSGGEQNSKSSSGSVAEIRDRSSGKKKISSEKESESEVEIISGGVNSGKNKASVSVETTCEERKKEKREGEEKAEDKEKIFPVGWRTRSYTKIGNRVDYSSFYKNTDYGSGSEDCVEFEEEESGSEDSESYVNSGSDKQGRLWEGRRKSKKHSTVKCSACSLNTDTVSPIQHKEKLRMGKEFEAFVSSSDCSLDIDEVPILERMNRMRKHTPDEEGCSRGPFEEFNAVYVSSSDDAEERVRKVHKSKRVAKGKCVRKSESRKRRREIPDKDLFDFLMASLDADGEEILESSQNHLPRVLPMLFDFRSDDETPVEKSEFEKLIEEAWKDFDFALGVENLGSYKPDEATARRDAFYTATGNYCSNGEHEMHLDEQIGYKCRHCSYIETEIRDILPPFKATQARKAPAGENQMNEKDIFRFDDLHEKHEIHDRPDSSFQKTGTVWDLIPGLINTLYPNQKEAFEFMWQNLAGGIRLDEIKSPGTQSDNLGGCVISHAPGTGKTRLAIVFLQSYMKAFPDCKPVVIAPAHLLSMWNTEFKKWGFNLPFHDINCEDFTGKEHKGLLANRHRSLSKNMVRLVKLLSWSCGNGVLGISYSLFNNYVSGKSNENPEVGEMLLSKPDLLILDEGHIPRNENSQLWNGLSKVKTEKRIILSGTPFQNNFSELYNILCLFRPTFAKKLNVQTETERRKNHVLWKKKEKPTKDIWTTSTRNVTAANAEEVRSILKPFVHVYNGEILKSLPGLRECVIILNPEAIQSEVIQKLGQAMNSSTFDRDCKISLPSIHPYLLTFLKLTTKEISLLDMDRLKNLCYDPYAGVKTKFVIEFIRLADKLNEKVLIFSQYVKPLELIMKQLTSIKLFQWTEGTEVLLIHGKIPAKERERSITSFNDRTSNARVLLASTKACSEGISLTGASRVILLDVVWNPSVGKQAIGRAFRIGQERVVHTYNLITDGTDEMEKYKVQMKKEKLSKLVFSLEDGTSDGGQRGQLGGDGDVSMSEVEDKILEAITANEKLKKIFAKIYYTKSDDWRDYMDL